MKSKALIAAVVAVAFAACLSLVYNGTDAAGKRMATLTNVKGTVLVKAGGSSEWVQASDRMVINEGDEIKTRGGSSAILKMDDGSMMKVGPLASMKVEQLSKDGRNNRTEMGVEIGKTWNRVNRLTSDSKFNVKTPTAVAGVRGTYFSSEVEKTTDSTFDVFDGQIEVSSSSDPSSAVVVGENQRTQVAPGQTPSAPSDIPSNELDSDGFSNAEAALATYDLQLSVSPQVVTPGEKATVSVQVFKNGQPDRKQYTMKLTLSGSATFVDSGSSELEVTTDDQGAATVEITSTEKETVTVSAELKIKVPKS